MVCRHHPGWKLYRGRRDALGFRAARAYRITDGVNGSDGVTDGIRDAPDDVADGVSHDLGNALGDGIADDNDAALTLVNEGR